MLAAVLASTLYSLGVALQAMDAKEAPSAAHLRLALVRQLMTRGRWLLGTALSIMGWPLQVVALLLAPLVVVQPTLAVGLLVLMIAGERMLGESAGLREHLAMAAIVAGVAGVAFTAPARGTSHSGDETLLVVLLALGVMSLLPYALRVLHRHNASITMLSAGLAFGWRGVATKLASDDIHRGHLAVALGWAVGTAAASAVGALSEMSALQARPAIQVAPVVFVTQTVVPVALAPLVLGERFPATALEGAALTSSLALLVAGAAVLARSPLLLALMKGDRVSGPSGSAPSPRTRSRETSRSNPATDAGEPSALTTRTSPARTDR